MENDRYAYYSTLVPNVRSAINSIQELEYSKCFDRDYLEHTLIPALGLNNEHLHEQPEELSPFFGTGLHLWQYPSQLADYLVWLSLNGKGVKRYMEIGCRWGGTFIVVNEWLKKIGAPIEVSIAVDPVPETPFIKEYIAISNTPVVYLNAFSTSQTVIDYTRMAKPDMVFIDGDHSMAGVMFDHGLVRKNANIIVHHDIASFACPPTVAFWNYAREAEENFESFEFVNQYESVKGNFLGIGAMKRI
jgi:cephalosporin hydroxylase